MLRISDLISALLRASSRCAHNTSNWTWQISESTWKITNHVTAISIQGKAQMWRHRSYVYWTVHHLDSWVKRDQLDATCFIITLFSSQHVSDVSTSILRSLRLIRWVTSWVVSGSMCVGVTLWFGCGGVVSVCRLKPATRIPLQPNHTENPTHIISVPIRPHWRGVAVQVVWPVPEAAGTVFNTPDDGCCDTRNM